jgi:hypothetical protein
MSTVDTTVGYPHEINRSRAITPISPSARDLDIERLVTAHNTLVATPRKANWYVS